MKPLQDAVNANNLMLATSFSDTRELAPGESFSVRIKSPQPLFLISGAVEIRLSAAIFGSYCCQRLEAGDWLLPQAEPFFCNVRHYLVKSTSTSRFMVVSQAAWNRSRARHDETTLALQDALLARVSALRREVARFSLEAELRVVHYLITEQVITHGGQLTLSTTFQKLAKKLNLAPPTLSRALNSLEERGFLERNGRQLRILQMSLRRRGTNQP